MRTWAAASVAATLLILSGCGEAGSPTESGAEGETPAVSSLSDPSIGALESSDTDVQLDLVSINPASPAPGQVVEIVVRAHASGLLHEQVVSLGDGRSISRGLGTGCSTMGDYVEPPPPPNGPSEATATIATTYSEPGDYSIRIEANAYAECPQLDQGTGSQAGHLTVPLSVTDGPVVGNGDLPPSASLTESIGWGGTDVRVEANGTDEDGWIAEFSIDWGDDSTPTTLTRTEPCVPGPGGWPMNAAYTEAVTHTYPAPGEYTATLTVLSTSCDGTREQTARGSNLVVFPSR